MPGRWSKQKNQAAHVAQAKRQSGTTWIKAVSYREYL